MDPNNAKQSKQSVSQKKKVFDIYSLLCEIDNGYEPTVMQISLLDSWEDLDLSNKGLEKIPKSIRLLHSLRSLRLSNNHISEIPPEVGQLTSLRYLSLSDNQIASLPASIGKLSNLIHLFLSKTDLATLPDSIGSLTNLQYFNLDNTKLVTLPKSFGHLSSLVRLNLSMTALSFLPESIGQLSKLQTLDLSSTQITELPESIGQLSKLQALDLSSTPITALPESIGQLSKLQKLSIYYTSITTLPESLAQLNLQALDLRSTRLVSLPEQIGDLPNLTVLDLRGLTLTHIPRSLACKGLRFIESNYYTYGINLHNTTLTEQDKSIFLQNDVGLITDLYRKAEQISLQECRVIFLGDGDSGKSYTIRRFMNNGRKETAEVPYVTSETPGVEIRDYTTKWDDEGFKIHFWDFGGQQLLHAMHRCFLTEDTCYVVTVKSRETKADDRARYWLRNVTAFAPKSPILLYVNCWDNDNGRRVLDEPRLRKDFPMIAKVVYVSAKVAEDNGFREELMVPLIIMAAESSGCKRRVNRRWKAVRDAIEAESREKDYLTKDRYHQICASNGIEDENAPALLSYFNSLGVCFSYHRDENKQELADYRLLKPVWLTNAIYAIIEEGMGRAEEGRIAATEVVDMLCGKVPAQLRGRDYRRTVPEIVYQKNECSYIIDVAVLHKLCYRIDKDTLFFPALCSTDSPPEAMEEPGDGLRSMEYRLKYSYLPDNVIHRLMIRCMQSDYAVERCWLRGLILNHAEGPRVLVRMDDDETLRIDLWANPKRPAFMIFLRLREEILRINDDLGLKAKDLIVDGEDQYSVVSLLRASEKHSSVFGNNSGAERDARDLLGDFYESRIIEDMRVENNTIIIPILPYEYHHCRQDDPDLRVALYDAYNHVCAYCGEPIRVFREMEVDHIFPSKYQKLPELEEYVKYLNGHGFNTEKPDYVENYFPAHRVCNGDKSNRTEPFSLMAWHLRAARIAPRVLRLIDEQKKGE